MQSFIWINFREICNHTSKLYFLSPSALSAFLVIPAAAKLENKDVFIYLFLLLHLKFIVPFWARVKEHVLQEEKRPRSSYKSNIPIFSRVNLYAREPTAETFHFLPATHCAELSSDSGRFRRGSVIYTNQL